jgi:CO/xanthine dehydrogenase Mo-binding subunit
MNKGVGIDQDAKTPYTSCPQPDVAQEAAKAFGWRETWKGWGTPIAVVGSKRRGIGLALGASSKGRIRPPMSGIVIVNTDGTIQVLTGSADTGTGTGSTALPIIAAEELGVDFEALRATWGDTAVTQDTGMQNGSTMTRSGGMGILMAARDAKKQLFELAAPKLGVKPEDLEAKGGRIYVKGTPEKGLSIKEVASTAPAPIIGRGNYTVPPGYSQAHFHTAMAEVEVDTDTGEVAVLRYVASHGIGRVIFRLGSESQVDGCVINGLEHGLFGVLLFDPTTGIPINANYLDYKLPTVLDAPRKIVPVFVEQNDPIAPFGAIGLGEPPNEGPGAAVRNAILHATGVSLMDLPLYPEKILKALGKVR